MTKIGYARVSTKDQNISLQTDALDNFGCTKIFTEVISGASKDRPELENALSYLREGDTLVVWRIDRLGRTLKRLISLIEELKARNIGFASTQECFDTSTSIGKMFFQIVGAFAEMEREILIERTRAGLEAARARGKKGGRKYLLAEEQVERMVTMHKDRTILNIMIIKAILFQVKI